MLPTPRLAIATLALLAASSTLGTSPSMDRDPGWRSIGLSGGGAMFRPAISGVDPDLMLVNCDMSAAYVSRDGGRSWEMIHAYELGGNTRCRPAWHPRERDTVYAASGWAGRLKVSRDAGRTFTELGDLPVGLVGEIHVVTSKPELIFAGVREGTWRSEDGGEHWTSLDGPPGAVRDIASLTTKSARHVWIATGEGLFRSDDDGDTWTPATAGLTSTDVRSVCAAVDQKGRRAVLYAAVRSESVDGVYRGGVFKSDDLGERWISVMNDTLNRDVKPADRWAHGEVAQYLTVLCAEDEPDVVWAFNANTGVLPPHHTAAYRSEDGGRSWRATFFPDPRFAGYNLETDYVAAGDGQFYQAPPDEVAICPTDPDVVIQVDAGSCLVTHDGGKSWFCGHTHETRKKGFFESTGLVVTSTWHYRIDPHEPKRHYICYTDIGFARSLDAGATWHWWGKDEKAPWRNTCYDLAFDAKRAGRMWGAFSDVHDIPNDNVISGRHRSSGRGGVCASEDFSETWTPCEGLPVAPATSIVREACLLEPGDRCTKRRVALLASFFGEGVFASTDDGRSWRALGRIGSETNRRAVRVQVAADGRIFALVTALRKGREWDESGPGLYRWDGDAWTRVCASLRWPKDFAIDPADSGHLLVGAADAGGPEQGGLWETRDGGSSWTRILREGPQHFGAAFSPFHEDWIYATLCEGAPGPGLWLSRDGGESWEGFDELPFRNVQRVELDPKARDEVIVTTFGGSIWRGPAEP